MAKYKMGDGTVVKTENARATWKEDTRFDGRNNISVNTGSQWDHQQLYLSRKGRYWLEYRQGTTPHAEWISAIEAARWLVLNGEDLPSDLEQFLDEIEE
jgi:hypothetical protein